MEEFYRSKTIKSEDIKVELDKRVMFNINNDEDRTIIQVIEIEHKATGIITCGEDKTQLGAYKKAMKQLERDLALKGYTKDENDDKFEGDSVDMENFYESNIKSEDIKVHLCKEILNDNGSMFIPLVWIEHLKTGAIVYGKDISQLGAYKKAMISLEKWLGDKDRIITPRETFFNKLGDISKLEGYISRAMVLAKIELSIDNLDKLLTRAIKESNGNPRIVDKIIPHKKGLMGLLDKTFNEYKMEGYDDIYNPVDNTIACINYSLARFGKITDVEETFSDRVLKQRADKEDEKSRKEIYNSLMKNFKFKSNDEICEPSTNDIHRFSNDELIEELKRRIK